MGQVAIAARALPADPIDAAAAFHSGVVPTVKQALALESDVVLLFDRADAIHDGWRLAAVRDLARMATPARVNAAAGADGAAMDEVLAYLAAAPGITGQVLIVDAIPVASA